MNLRMAANCSMLFTELPLAQRPAAAVSAGFGAVEFWWPFGRSVPGDAEVGSFVRSITDAGVALVALNLAAGDLAAGERGLMNRPERQDQFRDSVEVAVGIAGELGVAVCNALHGKRVAGVAAAAQDAVAVENYAFAGAALARVGTGVVIEPLSGVADYPLQHAADVLALIDRVGGADLRMLADLYHLAVNGDDVAAVIAAHTPSIGHVQIADAPGRHEPGTGNLPLTRWLDDLEAAGYGGWVALEYIPVADTASGLSQWFGVDA